MAQWTYSDWVTLDNSPTKLARLRLHIQEVSDRLSSGSYTVPGFTSSKSDLVTYHDRLGKAEEKLAASPSATAGTRSRFVRGNPLR